jgi:GTP-binding protein
MVPEEERAARVKDFIRRFRWKGPVIEVSALARQGLVPLVERIYQEVSKHHREEKVPDPRFDVPTEGSAA